MNETILMPSLDEFMMLSPELQIGFMHLGDGQWEAIVNMRDCGGHLLFADCGLHLYRGPQIGGAGSPIFTYGFHPGAVTPETIRKVNKTHAFKGIKKLFGRDPDHPTPWIDAHPIYQLRPRAADLLLQTNRNRPEWNRFKSFTSAGDDWLKGHIRGDDLVKAESDGTFTVIHPKDYEVLAAGAEASGLSVWRH